MDDCVNSVSGNLHVLWCGVYFLGGTFLGFSESEPTPPVQAEWIRDRRHLWSWFCGNNPGAIKCSSPFYHGIAISNTPATGREFLHGTMVKRHGSHGIAIPSTPSRRLPILRHCFQNQRAISLQLWWQLSDHLRHLDVACFSGITITKLQQLLS